jgi:hypothetical protein
VSEAFVDMVVLNYPANGTESLLKDISFGPVSEDMNLLITVSGEDGTLGVTIGNGPEMGRLPVVIPALLRELADLLESVTL